MAKVLIADDNQDFASLLDSLLSADGYETFVVYSGDAAIDFLKDNSDCDVLVTDIIMPGVDGFDLIEYANKNTRVKIIAMTGGGVHLSSDKAIETIKDQVHDTLTKPFPMQDLLTCVQDVLKA